MRQIITALTTGYILMYFSEFVFYGEIAAVGGSDVPTLSQIIMLYWVYCLLGYTIHTVIRVFRVDTIWGLFLVGAVYGWLLEGCVVTTMYHDFPLQVHFTSIAWHAPLDVVFGWYFMQRTLREEKPLKVLGISGLLGLFLGSWVMWRWWEEGVPVAYERFAGLTVASTILLAGAYWLSGQVSAVLFEPVKWVNRLITVLFGVWFVVNVLPVYPVVGWMLPLLLGVSFYALSRNRDSREAGVDLLTNLKGKPGILNLFLLSAVPIVAGSAYGLYLGMGFQLPMSSIGYVVFSVVGIVWFLASLSKMTREVRPSEKVK